MKLERPVARALAIAVLSGAPAFLAHCSAPSDAAPASPETVADTGSPTTPLAEAGVDADSAPAVFAPAAHRPWPVLVRGTGHVLQPLTLVTLVAENDDLATQLFAFGDTAITSEWWRETGGEYGVGTANTSVHVTVPAITHDLTQTDVTATIERAIASSLAPAANENTLYLLYVPAPYEATGLGSTAYHGALTTTNTSYAVVSRVGEEADQSVLDSLTERASHEIIEAATDTRGGWRLPEASATPWNDLDTSIWRSSQPGVIENGDLCEGSRVREPLAGGFLFQRSWSNAAAAKNGGANDPCVPARSEPYFNVSIASDWISIAAGATITIPFSGWSSGATSSWFVNAGVNHGQGSLSGLSTVPGGGLKLVTSLGVGTAPKCGPRQAVNNGTTGTLTVTAPSDAAKGDYAVIWINSFREEPSTCNPRPDVDWHHYWPVGVHVE